MRPQIDYLKKETKRLSAGNFRAVLDYYGIPVRNNSILCPLHHDTRYGSCRLRADGRSAYCFTCEKSIDGVTVVMRKDGLGYPDAMRKLWCDILGNPLPDADDGPKRKWNSFPLTSAELRFIGLDACYGGSVLLPKNKCEKNDDVLGKQYGTTEPEGGSLVADDAPYPSVSKLYETNRKFATYLMLGKADETIARYERLAERPSELDEIAGSPKELEAAKALARERLKTARAIKNKIKGPR
jgi:hypothetical protein